MDGWKGNRTVKVEVIRISHINIGATGPVFASIANSSQGSNS